MLCVHVRGADGPVGIVAVELDDVVGAEVLSCRVAADGIADDCGELVAGEVCRWKAVFGVVGVHWIGEAISEHCPVTPVDSDRILCDRVADEGAVLELAHPRLEIVSHRSFLPFFDYFFLPTAQRTS
jgi:hypothetical protein